jgi:hypothetical protein
MRQLTTNRDAARIVKSELASLRAAIGCNAADMLLYVFECGGQIDRITPTSVHVSQKIIDKARKKLEAYGLIRTTHRPGHAREYEIIGKDDLEMLLPAWEQWVDEREKALERKVAAGAA